MFGMFIGWRINMQKLLENKLGIKFLVIGALVVMLLIPIVMIKGLIYDRENMQRTVENDIASSSSGEQTVMGPFIEVEYTEPAISEGKEVERIRNMYILPEQFYLNSKLNSFEKYRGIYKALLYRTQNKAHGQFKLSGMAHIPKERINKISLALAIEDVRGVGLGSKIALAGQTRPIYPGTNVERRPDGIHVKLDKDALDLTQPLDYTINFDLQGMKSLYFVPVGKETSIELDADWPHPSFVGDFLPQQSNITDSGHSARWITNPFSTNMAGTFESCGIKGDCNRHGVRKIGVSLIEPVDHYLKGHRAVNYALMIILLVFATFFLLEIFRAKPIHPIQYGFVGLALAVFYLLLISLSEHIGFGLAYGISSIASVALLSIYVAGMLNSSKQGGICFGAMAVLYAVLYGLLSAEDYALLMGSILCFAVLGLVMTLTRKVDWYSGKMTVTERT